MRLLAECEIWYYVKKALFHACGGEKRPDYRLLQTRRKVALEKKLHFSIDLREKVIVCDRSIDLDECEVRHAEMS